jgi:hypothetical protein
MMRLGEQGDVKRALTMRCTVIADLIGKYGLAFPRTTLNDVHRAGEQAPMEYAIQPGDARRYAIAFLPKRVSVVHALIPIPSKAQWREY